MKNKEQILEKAIENATDDLSQGQFELVLSAMDEYAKQQSVEFVKWAIENNKIVGDNWDEAYMPGDEEQVYDQFFEHQKQNNQ